MKFNLKKKLLLKYEKFVINDPICFLFVITGSSGNWILTEQKLKKKKLLYFKLFNTLIRSHLLKTSFKLKLNIFTNSILAINFKNHLNFFDIKSVLNLKLNLYLICLNFFNRFYHKYQLKSLICLKYINNIKFLNFNLLKSIKIFYYRFSK
jgi:hypothetical protein